MLVACNSQQCGRHHACDRKQYGRHHPCNRQHVVDIMLVQSRIFTCLRALIFGEDFSSDPVSRVFGLIVHKSSGGQVQVDTAILSQVQPLSSLQLVTDMRVTGWLSALLCCQHTASTWSCLEGMPSGISSTRQLASLHLHLFDML